MKIIYLMFLCGILGSSITSAAASDCQDLTGCNEMEILKRGYLRQQFYKSLAIGDMGQVRYYIESNIFDVNEKMSDYDDTPLSVIAYHGSRNSVAIAEYVIGMGGNVNHVLKGAARSPFLKAVWKKNNDVARLLIKNGADLSIKSDRGYDACIFAHRWSNFEIMPDIPNCCEKIRNIQAEGILKEDKLRPVEFYKNCIK